MGGLDGVRRKLEYILALPVLLKPHTAYASMCRKTDEPIHQALAGYYGENERCKSVHYNGRKERVGSVGLFF
jgi:hypothetical protein